MVNKFPYQTTKKQKVTLLYLPAIIVLLQLLMKTESLNQIKNTKKLGYPVIAINPNNPAVQPKDGFEEMKVRAKEKGFTFPYLFDDGQKIYPQYGATKTPHVYILKKQTREMK